MSSGRHSQRIHWTSPLDQSRRRKWQRTLANGNLIGDPNGAGIIDPLLGPLADNGGWTRTHALLPGSPAFNAGDPALNPVDPDGDSLTDDAIPYDQRGFPFDRISGGRIDIGAFEAQVALPVLLGDYNHNNVIDAADYTVWRDAMKAGSTILPNDATPGVVDESDFLYWRDHFGETSGSGASAGVATAVEAASHVARLPIAERLARRELYRAFVRVWGPTKVVADSSESPSASKAIAFVPVFGTQRADELRPPVRSLRVSVSDAVARRHDLLLASLFATVPDADDAAANDDYIVIGDDGSDATSDALDSLFAAIGEADQDSV